MNTAPTVAPQTLNARFAILAVLAVIGLLKAVASAQQYWVASEEGPRMVAAYQGVAGLIAFVVLGAWALRARRAR